MKFNWNKKRTISPQHFKDRADRFQLNGGGGGEGHEIIAHAIKMFSQSELINDIELYQHGYFDGVQRTYIFLKQLKILQKSHAAQVYQI